MADSRTNESFSRLDEASISENKQIEERENLDTRDVKRRIEELDRYLAVNRPPKEDVQHAQQSVEETVLSREFPKTYPIRQVNGETPRVQKNKVKSSMFDEKLPSPNNGTVANTASSRSGQKAFPVADLASEKTIPETLPVKPNALQVTERSFLSTEIVRLPTAGNLARPKAKPTAQDTAKMNSNNSSSERIPTFVHPEDAAKNNSFPIDSKETTQQLSIERNSSVLRPRGKFVNPRNL